MNTREFVSKIADSASAYPDAIFGRKGRVHTCVNPYSYHLVRQYRDLYGSMDGLFVDGMTMTWWLRLLWGKKIPRLSFDMSGMAVDLFSRLNAPDCEEDIYFIGAKQEEIEGSMQHITKAYPGMRIAGYRNGYFIDIDDRKRAIAEIVSRNPSFVVVGMGSPLQEVFVADLKKAGFHGVAFTCGGFLHQTSTKINYYPDWVNRLNLRAFYRLFHEKGMARRLWDVLIGFPSLFFWDSVRDRLAKK